LVEVHSVSISNNGARALMTVVYPLHVIHSTVKTVAAATLIVSSAAGKPPTE
jgi:hypothetical protein